MSDVLTTASYADFKLIANAFTSGKVLFWSGTGAFKIWGMASGFPFIEVLLTSQPGTFATDFPAAIQIAAPLSGGLQ